MEWFVAHTFLSESGSTANPTSQQSPDGLAANVLTRDGAIAAVAAMRKVKASA